MFVFTRNSCWSRYIRRWGCELARNLSVQPVLLRFVCHSLQVAMIDDTLAATVLENDHDITTLDPDDLVGGIRRACRAGAGIPVQCGSALRGVAIQPLMDAVSAYLPPAREASLRV